jgi:hypothetical protein
MRDIDRYFGNRAAFFDALKTRLSLALIFRGARMDADAIQHWRTSPSALLDGINLLEATSSVPSKSINPGEDLIVSTVRMGYGHHRIALAIASWAGFRRRRAHLLDLLATPRDESKAIQRMDRLYSAMSRISAHFGGPLEAFWGQLMQSGGIGACRLADGMAARLGALMADLPRDVPIITAYPLNGHLAVRLGFRRVVNLIFDNDPQHFLVVPGALNLVQTTSSYEALRMMGVPENEVAVAGHWVSRELVQNAEKDARDRMARARAGLPRRLCIAIGGAGAQFRFYGQYIRGLKDLIERGGCRLLINLGDHSHLRESFEKLLNDLNLTFGSVHDFEGLKRFCNRHALSAGNDQDLFPVTLFSQDEHLEAVRGTDLLMRASDVLVTKPSELAFVPVPKVHIRRVGDHEAASARRSAEIGDGTLEWRKPADAVRMTRLLSEGPEFIVPMNERIVRNTVMGLYDGARRAVGHALKVPRALTGPKASILPMKRLPQKSEAA